MPSIVTCRSIVTLPLQAIHFWYIHLNHIYIYQMLFSYNNIMIFYSIFPDAITITGPFTKFYRIRRLTPHRNAAPGQRLGIIWLEAYVVMVTCRSVHGLVSDFLNVPGIRKTLLAMEAAQGENRRNIPEYVDVPL